MARHGVLVVGPNPAFINHISRVLPSLGESDVVFVTPGELVPGLRVTLEDGPEAARLKGSLKILDVLRAAITARQQLAAIPCCSARTAPPGRSLTCRCWTSWWTCSAGQAGRRHGGAGAEGAGRVRRQGLDSLVGRADSMDYEDHLYATDLLHAEDLADRFVEVDARDLAERAAEDRDWTYRHVVVDEAQELSEMDWRVLMRRCPGRSFTVVGDLARRRAPAVPPRGDTMLAPYVPGRWVYRSLTVARPPRSWRVAAAVLAEFAPTVQPPESVRAAVGEAGDRGRTSRRHREVVRDEAGRARVS